MVLMNIVILPNSIPCTPTPILTEHKGIRIIICLSLLFSSSTYLKVAESIYIIRSPSHLMARSHWQAGLFHCQSSRHVSLSSMGNVLLSFTYNNRMACLQCLCHWHGEKAQSNTGSIHWQCMAYPQIISIIIINTTWHYHHHLNHWLIKINKNGSNRHTWLKARFFRHHGL